MRLVILMCCLILPLAAQGPVNLTFEDSGPQGQPIGWASNANPDYSVATADDCRSPGSRCLVVRHQGQTIPQGRLYVTQSFDAQALRGKRVRFGASLRFGVPSRAMVQVFMRVDRPSGVGFNEYSPLKSTDLSDWTTGETTGDIDPDAKRITIGFIFSGLGSAYLADSVFETVDN